MITVKATVEDPDVQLAAYGPAAKIRLESSANGSTGWGEVTTATIVSGEQTYYFNDENGTASTWYRLRYSTVTPIAADDYSAFAAAFRGRELLVTTGPTLHCYANVAQFKRFLLDTGTDFGTASDDDLLNTLQSASRSADAHCQRGGVLPVFGPTVVTRRYTARGGTCLDLGVDFYSITGVTAIPSFGSAPITYTVETDFYLEPFDGPPYRSLTLISGGQGTWYGTVRGVTVTGITGKHSETQAYGTLSGGISATVELLTMVSPPSPGHTLRIGTEDLYVRAVNENETLGYDVTIARGANGTTAAIHSDAAPVSVYVYPAEATRATLVLGQRRRKSRDAGLTGDFGGGPVPITINRDTERNILREYLWPHALVSV